jgi:uncharacterized protein (TIGR00369 family)
MADSRIAEFFQNEVPFNRLLGLKVLTIGAGKCRCTIPFRADLVGDPFRPALHGGLTSTLADTAGGLAVYSAVGSLDARVSTIDLRVDYYAPGELRDLYADAEVARIGNRVGVARVVLHHGDPEAMVAEGRGVYSVRRPDDQGRREAADTGALHPGDPARTARGS